MAITRMDITAREPLLGGKHFGTTGAYEMLRGTVTCAVDPAHPQNQCITDLEKAPRTTAGKVEWWADVILLQPIDPTRGNRRLFFEVVNRGRILTFRMFDAVAETPHLTRPEHVGNGFLLHQGYTVAWCGWQWDVVRLPLATYMGWNPRHPSQGAPEQSLRMHGATVPLAPTQSARAQSDDPRPSISERYASKEAYLELVTKAAERLVAEGYLLSADVDELVQRAAWRYDLFAQQV